MSRLEPPPCFTWNLLRLHYNNGAESISCASECVLSTKLCSDSLAMFGVNVTSVANVASVLASDDGCYHHLMNVNRVQCVFCLFYWHFVAHFRHSYVNGIKINKMAHTYTNRADNCSPNWLNDPGFMPFCLCYCARKLSRSLSPIRIVRLLSRNHNRNPSLSCTRSFIFGVCISM